MEPSATHSIVELVGVSRSFSGNRVRALDHVTLSIGRDSATVVVGRSGSGKTTLLSTIAGLAPPDSGRVTICDQSPTTAAAWARIRREHVGIVLQDPHLIPTLTAVENVELPMFGNRQKSAVRRRSAYQLLEGVGLEAQANQIVTTLSGGEKQRVAIARALANTPDLILADEPTGNLDRRTATEIADLLFTLRRNRRQTLIVVTHDLDLAARFDRFMEMDDGRLREVDGAEMPTLAHGAS